MYDTIIDQGTQQLSEFLNALLIGLVSVGCILCVVLSIVKFMQAAKAEDDGEAQKKRRAAIICLGTALLFLVIVVLYAVLYGTLVELIAEQLEGMET